MICEAETSYRMGSDGKVAAKYKMAAMAGAAGRLAGIHSIVGENGNG